MNFDQKMWNFVKSHMTAHSPAKDYIKANPEEFQRTYASHLYQLCFRPGVTFIVIAISIINFLTKNSSIFVSVVQLDLFSIYFLSMYLYEKGHRSAFLITMQCYPIVLAAGWISETYLIHSDGILTAPSQLQVGITFAIIWMLSFSQKASRAAIVAATSIAACLISLEMIDPDFFHIGDLERYMEAIAVGFFMNIIIAALVNTRFYASRKSIAVQRIFKSSTPALFSIVANRAGLPIIAP